MDIETFDQTRSPIEIQKPTITNSYNTSRNNVSDQKLSLCGSFASCFVSPIKSPLKKSIKLSTPIDDLEIDFIEQLKKIDIEWTNQDRNAVQISSNRSSQSWWLTDSVLKIF